MLTASKSKAITGNRSASFEAESDVRGDTSGPLLACKTPPRPSLLRRWYHCSVLRILIAEGRSLLGRIGWALEIHAWELRGCTGEIPSMLDSPLGPQTKKNKPAYSRYMRQIQTDHPFLSISDHLLAGQSWLVGWASCDRAHIQQSQNATCSSGVSGGGNSMPTENERAIRIGVSKISEVPVRTAQPQPESDG